MIAKIYEMFYFSDFMSIIYTTLNFGVFLLSIYGICKSLFKYISGYKTYLTSHLFFIFACISIISGNCLYGVIFLKYNFNVVLATSYMVVILSFYLTAFTIKNITLESKNKRTCSAIIYGTTLLVAVIAIVLATKQIIGVQGGDYLSRKYIFNYLDISYWKFSTLVEIKNFTSTPYSTDVFAQSIFYLSSFFILTLALNYSFAIKSKKRIQVIIILFMLCIICFYWNSLYCWLYQRNSVNSFRVIDYPSSIENIFYKILSLNPMDKNNEYKYITILNVILTIIPKVLICVIELLLMKGYLSIEKKSKIDK